MLNATQILKLKEKFLSSLNNFGIISFWGYDLWDLSEEDEKRRRKLLWWTYK